MPDSFVKKHNKIKNIWAIRSPIFLVFMYSMKNIKEIKKFIKRRDSFLPVAHTVVYIQEGCAAKMRAAKKEGRFFFNKYFLRNKNIKIVAIQCRVTHEK